VPNPGTPPPASAFQTPVLRTRLLPLVVATLAIAAVPAQAAPPLRLYPIAPAAAPVADGSRLVAWPGAGNYPAYAAELFDATSRARMTLAPPEGCGFADISAAASWGRWPGWSWPAGRAVPAAATAVSAAAPRSGCRQAPVAGAATTAAAAAERRAAFPRQLAETRPLRLSGGARALAEAPPHGVRDGTR